MHGKLHAQKGHSYEQMIERAVPSTKVAAYNLTLNQDCYTFMQSSNYCIRS